MVKNIQILNQKVDCMVFIIGRLKMTPLDSGDYGSFDSAKVVFLMRKALMKCLLEVARSCSETSMDRLNTIDFVVPLLTYITDTNPGKSKIAQSIFI